LGKNDNEDLSKHREDGIAKSSRNMTNGFGMYYYEGMCVETP